MKIIRKEELATCFSFVTITATFTELKEKFGNPSYVNRNAYEKVQYEWELCLEDGTPFLVYDWKENRLFGKSEKIEWHIGCVSNKDAINRVVAALSEKKMECHRMTF